MRRPFDGFYPITLAFGATLKDSQGNWIYSPTRPHRGTDYGTPSGVQMLAVTEGYAQQMLANDFGKNTQIDTPTHVFIIAHLSSQLGSGWVKEGQPIGKSGASGMAFGPHVHVQVLEKATGKWVDFELLLAQSMYNGKSAEQWFRELQTVAGIAAAREGYLNRVALAAGVNPGGNPIEGDDIAVIEKNIDAKNKRIVELEQNTTAVTKEKVIEYLSKNLT